MYNRCHTFARHSGRPPLAAPDSALGGLLVLETELREAPHRDTVLLIRPGELQPELTLGDRGGGVTAGDEEAQRGVALGAELMDARLQRAKLLKGPARQNPQTLLS